MVKPTNVKRKSGRPPEIGAGTFVGMRLPAVLLKNIDGWAKRRKISGRSEAMRALIEKGLTGTGSSTLLAASSGSRRSHRAKASDMAAKQIDRMGDQSATNEERTSRKRHLIKGPKEFRDIRGDHPKDKQNCHLDRTAHTRPHGQRVRGRCLPRFGPEGRPDRNMGRDDAEECGC
jgi:hypothetical protein